MMSGCQNLCKGQDTDKEDRTVVQKLWKLEYIRIMQ